MEIQICIRRHYFAFSLALLGLTSSYEVVEEQSGRRQPGAGAMRRSGGSGYINHLSPALIT